MSANEEIWLTSLKCQVASIADIKNAVTNIQNIYEGWDVLPHYYEQFYHSPSHLSFVALLQGKVVSISEQKSQKSGPKAIIAVMLVFWMESNFRCT